jgi:hypothetical protein
LHPHPILSVQYMERLAAPEGLRLGFAQKRFATGFNGGRKRIPLPASYVLAALNQLIGAIPQFACLFLGKLPAIVRTLAEKFPGFVAGLRGEENAEERSDAYAN